FGYARRLAGSVGPARAGAAHRPCPLAGRLALPARHGPRPPPRGAARPVGGPRRRLAARPRRVPRRLVSDTPVRAGNITLRGTLPWPVLVPALWSPAAAAEPPPRWVVVAAPAFRDAVEPLCKFRAEQKLDVVPLLTTDVLSADEIRSGDARKLSERVRQLC